MTISKDKVMMIFNTQCSRWYKKWTVFSKTERSENWFDPSCRQTDHHGRNLEEAFLKSIPFESNSICLHLLYAGMHFFPFQWGDYCFIMLCSFLHTITWISPKLHIALPSRTSLPPQPLSHPTRLSQSTSLSSLGYKTTFH